MPGDLETNLISGGVTPAAAKVISNAIANLATGRTNIGRQLEDATPVDRMRMISSDTRRYVLTNLDYPSAANPNSQFKPRNADHPYQDSQPATSNPTLATPSVTAGNFVSVGTKTANQVTQAEVGLNVEQMGGQHARLNHATGAIESVPISIEIEPKGLLEGEVVEEAGRTVIRLRIVSNALRGLLKQRLGQYTGITVSGSTGTLRVDNANVASGGAFLLMPE